MAITSSDGLKTKAVAKARRYGVRIIKEEKAVTLLRILLPSITAYPGTSSKTSRDNPNTAAAAPTNTNTTEELRATLQRRRDLLEVINRKDLGNVLKNKKVFVTGTLKVFPDYKKFASFIERAGGAREIKNVTKKVDYLVTGELKDNNNFFVATGKRFPSVKICDEEKFVRLVERMAARKTDDTRVGTLIVILLNVL